MSSRFHRREVVVGGRRQDRQGRTTLQNAGTIRRLVRGLIGYTGGPPPFSWTRNAFTGAPAGVQGPVTSPLRYLIDTRDTLTAGNQLSNPMVRPVLIKPRQAPSPPLVAAGNVQGRPTVRNRIQSFGSRVPPLNLPSVDALELPTP